MTIFHADDHKDSRIRIDIPWQEELGINLKGWREQSPDHGTIGSDEKLVGPTMFEARLDKMLDLSMERERRWHANLLPLVFNMPFKGKPGPAGGVDPEPDWNAWMAGSKTGQWPLQKGHKKTIKNASMTQILWNFYKHVFKRNMMLTLFAFVCQFFLGALPLVYAKINGDVFQLVFEDHAANHANEHKPNFVPNIFRTWEVVEWMSIYLAIYLATRIINFLFEKHVPGAGIRHFLRHLTYSRLAQKDYPRKLPPAGEVVDLITRVGPNALNAVWFSAFTFFQLLVTSIGALVLVFVNQNEEADSTTSKKEFFEIVIPGVAVFIVILGFVAWLNFRIRRTNLIDVVGRRERARVDMNTIVVEQVARKRGADSPDQALNRSVLFKASKVFLLRFFSAYTFTLAGNEIAAFMFQLGYVIMICLAGWQTILGVLTVGDFALLVTVFTTIQGSFNSLVQQIMEWPRSYVGILRLAVIYNDPVAGETTGESARAGFYSEV